MDALSKVGFGIMVAGLGVLLSQRLVLSPSVPIRHPIYTAVTLFGWACWLGHPTWFSAGMA